MCDKTRGTEKSQVFESSSSWHAVAESPSQDKEGEKKGTATPFCFIKCWIMCRQWSRNRVKLSSGTLPEVPYGSEIDVTSPLPIACCMGGPCPLAEARPRGLWHTSATAVIWPRFTSPRVLARSSELSVIMRPSPPPLEPLHFRIDRISRARTRIGRRIRPKTAHTRMLNLMLQMNAMNNSRCKVSVHFQA